MKKVLISILLSTVLLLSGCMTIINPIGIATVNPTLTSSLPPQHQSIMVRAYAVSTEQSTGIKCEFSSQGSFVYRFWEGDAPNYSQGDSASDFTPMPQDNVIPSEELRRLAVAQVDPDGKIIECTLFDYIPGANYYQSNSPQYASLVCAVTNTDKKDYTFGYGEVSCEYLQSVANGVNAGINYYCHEHQPFYSPVDGKIIAVTDESVNIYIEQLDATLNVLHLLDTAPSAELINTQISQGTLLGYTGGVGPTGFPEMHMELLVGEHTDYAGYNNQEQVVKTITYDVRILFDNKEYQMDTTKPSYVPYSVNVGGNAGFGLSVRENGYIYYLNPEDGNRIYRMKNDGTEKEKLTTDRARFLNVCEGWLYYSSPGNGLFFYRSRVDGSERELMYETSMSNFTIVGDLIYMETVTSSQRLHVLKTDKSGYTRISSGKVMSPFYYKGLLYTCAVRADMQLYTTKQTLDENGEIKYTYDKVNGIKATNVIVANDTIYYANAQDQDRLYKANLDGSEPTRLLDFTVADINYHDGYLYFTNVNDYSRVYRCSVDGSDFGAIMDTSYCCNLSIAGDWLFYNVNNDTTNAYTYDLLTGQTQKVK